jgi:hypothetical protein
MATTTNTITITWKAFGEIVSAQRFITSVSFDLQYDTTELTDETICDTIFHETNVYDGYLWRNKIEPRLNEYRTHTALSVGDEITINENTYRCENVGWKLLVKENA